MAHDLKSETEPLYGRMREVPPGPISYADFVEWLDEKTHAEWVDGEIVMMAPITFEHLDANDFLLDLVRAYVRRHKLGKVLREPFNMKTGPNLPERSPDMFYLANENMHRFKRTFVEGPADLVLEVISADSMRRNRVQKFNEYQTGGVREYWLVDPRKQESRFFILSSAGVFEEAVLEPGNIFRSTVLPGFWFRENWLWDVPQPTMEDVRREWGWP